MLDGDVGRLTKVSMKTEYLHFHTIKCKPIRISALILALM